MNRTLPENRRFGTIFNNDLNNITYSLDGANVAPGDYTRAVNAILDSRPGVFAQNVGLPEAVIYPTAVDTPFHTYMIEINKLTWPEDEPTAAHREHDVLQRLFELGADPLSLTIGCCRERGVPIVASYRMNSEDYYQNTYLASDFGRSHPEWRIRESESTTGVIESGQRVSAEQISYTGALDPAIPEVFEHRLAIFREVAERYDVDGIEFDFRRWTNMVSRPLENHPVLTRMVHRARAMLDEVAAKKGRERLLLGARVGPSLDDPPGTEYPGGNVKTDMSCRLLGLDVRAWIGEGLVDYVCPSLFWPRWPGLPNTAEFVALCKGSRVGVYPTLFPRPSWLDGADKGERPIEIGQTGRLLRYKNDFTDLALQLYADGAHGISTFNWHFHLRKARAAHLWTEPYGYGIGGDSVQAHLLSILGNPRALREYRDDPEALPTERALFPYR